MLAEPLRAAEQAARVLEEIRSDDGPVLPLSSDRAPPGGEDSYAYALGHVGRFDPADFVAVELRSDMAYDFVSTADVETSLELYDRHGHRVGTVDPGDAGGYEPPGSDWIVGFAPAEDALHFLRVAHDTALESSYAVGVYGTVRDALAAGPGAGEAAGGHAGREAAGGPLAAGDAGGPLAAGDAVSVTVEDVRGLALLYEAAFDRDGAIDAGGLDFWIDRLEDGATLGDVAAAFLWSSEFEAAFGTVDAMSGRGLVELLYRHVLGREGDAGGVAHWTARLEEGGLDPAGLLVAFAGSAETAAANPWLDGLVELAPGEWELAG